MCSICEGMFSRVQHFRMSPTYQTSKHLEPWVSRLETEESRWHAVGNHGTLC